MSQDQKSARRALRVEQLNLRVSAEERELIMRAAQEEDRPPTAMVRMIVLRVLRERAERQGQLQASA